MLSFYGIQQGLRQARKHLGWYLDRHAAGGGAERQAIMTSTEPALVIAALRDVFARGWTEDASRSAA